MEYMNSSDVLRIYMCDDMCVHKTHVLGHYHYIIILNEKLIRFDQDKILIYLIYLIYLLYGKKKH